MTFTILFAVCGCKRQQEIKQPTPSLDFRAWDYHSYNKNWDSALYYYDRIINSSGDSLEKAMVNSGMGLRQFEAGDYSSAQESLLSSLKTWDERDTAHHVLIASDYNTLANATLELKDYASAIRYYRRGLEYSIDRDYQLYILNNLGVAYQRMDSFQRAIAVLDSAAALTTMDASLKAKIISNLARTKWLEDSGYVPLPEYWAALALRSMAKDSLGMNASLAHLSEYYTDHRPDSALYYALKRFEIAQALADPADRLGALEQLTRVGPIKDTKKYTEQYIKLNDSLSNARSTARNQYALIKFDVQKSKADNLLLQKHIGKQRLVIWATVAFAILVILALVYRARERRRRLRQESENAIREERLKTSQKVHDVVANGLYRIMNELEHSNTVAKEPLIDRIEQLYEQSRDISYEPARLDHEEFHQQVCRLITSFANDQTKVIVVGDQKHFWSAVNAAQKHQLQLVIEELMVNMKKHSRARNVVFHFHHLDGVGHISYKDDGLGFKPGLRFGNGLQNTVNRMKSINGNVSFDKTEEGGASISISFPLERF